LQTNINHSDPLTSPAAHLLGDDRRKRLAADLNSALLGDERGSKLHQLAAMLAERVTVLQRESDPLANFARDTVEELFATDAPPHGDDNDGDGGAAPMQKE
jgi:hypothetical protein